MHFFPCCLGQMEHKFLKHCSLYFLARILVKALGLGDIENFKIVCYLKIHFLKWYLRPERIDELCNCIYCT